MDILVVAATHEEVKGIDLKDIERSTPHAVDVRITGVGTVATTYYLSKLFIERKYDLALNIGLAGSFNDKYKIGDVVNITSDCFADTGAEDDEKFLDLHELGFMDKNLAPFKNGKLAPHTIFNTIEIPDMPQVSGITVNKVHGNETSIEKVKKLFHPDVESMEGAAFFYVCMLENIPCVQLRAISNKVEKRNREAWNIPLAIESMGKAVNKLITEI